MASFEDIPHNVLYKIVSYLTIADKFKLLGVNKKLKRAIEESLKTEKTIYMTDYSFEGLNPTSGYKIKHDFTDQTFWKRIFTLMPNLENIYFKSHRKYVDLHRSGWCSGPDFTQKMEFNILDILFESLSHVKRLVSPELELYDWPHVSPSLEELHVATIDPLAMNSLIGSMTPIKRIKATQVNMEDWSCLPEGITHLDFPIRSFPNTDMFTKIITSPAAPTIEFLGEVTITIETEIPVTARLPRLKRLEVVFSTNDVDDAVKELAGLVSFRDTGGCLEDLSMSYHKAMSPQTWRFLLETGTLSNLKRLYLNPSRNELPDLSLAATFCPHLESLSFQVHHKFDAVKVFDQISRLTSLRIIDMTLTEIVVTGQQLVKFITDLFGGEPRQLKVNMRAYHLYMGIEAGFDLSIQDQVTLANLMNDKGLLMKITTNQANHDPKKMDVLTANPSQDFKKQDSVKGILIELLN